MAEDDPVRHLCEEATCPVCLEYFQEPVVAECGHVFCRPCIAQCCAKAGGEEAACCCPQCREPLQQNSLRPVLPLASIVGIAQRFCLQLAKGAEALGRACPKHQEPLKLFCKDDETSICVVCDKSREHRGHQVIPSEEALEEYKGTIRSHLVFLEQEKNEVLSSKLFGETESQSLLEKTEAQRQKIVAEFKQLHEFLEERERLLLAQLKDLDDEINDHSEKLLARLLEKLSSFDKLIKEMEEKQEQPVDEFFQDLRNTLQRCPKEKFISPEAFPNDLKERIEKWTKMHPFLNSTIKTFKDTVIAGPPENKGLPPQKPPQYQPLPLYGVVIMAAVSPLQELCNETTCSICLEYFTDPVTVECGHNFCRACLVQHWATARPEVLCPQCREPVQKKAFRLNWQLANLVEIVKKLEEEKAAEGTKRECKRHQKPLNFFCKYDESLICVGCTEHRDHAVVPLEEAVQKYKEKIQAQMKPLEQSRKNIARRKITDDERNKICLAQLDKEKQKIRTTFKQMQKFLKEKECLWLAQLGDLEKEMEKRQQENVSGFTNKISLLDKLLTEMEEKSKQPAGEFLQDIRSTFRRWMLEARQIVEISSELEEKLRSFCQKGSALNKAMEKFKESLEKTMNKGSLKDARNKVRVILDPDTAHPFLILSEDLDSVKWEDRYQDLPDNPGRFNREFCVLGQGGFLSGRHCWEVEVQEAAGAMWAVGAARESVKRKGIFKFSPNEGIWAVGKKPYDSISPCHLCALTSPEWSPLTLKKEPKKIRVSLEYEEGCVQFFDADTEDLIFTFPSASFREEKIQPFFWVVSGVRMNC